jgi:cellulase/cellobiase CelA1
LWIKRPVNPTEHATKVIPPAGAFMNQYAIDLTRNAGQ